ncbi:serine dehydratase beta chain [Arthrobacter sp. U41]|uniref:serine dehydratase beta chain n=1 Tax=Arthrobacter sp. U41 TaxID=1849032 RepID=UPI0022B223CC|nr:serine dehydratase beta chain [Arthrobacter sp. U41]
MFGSLGATGRGHGSTRQWSWASKGWTRNRGHRTADDQVAGRSPRRRTVVCGDHRVDFNWDEDVVLHRRKSLPAHPNGMTFRALDHTGAVLRSGALSIGAASLLMATPTRATGGGRRYSLPSRSPQPTNSWRSAAGDMSISDVMLANELVWRSEAELREGSWPCGRSCASAWRTAAPRKGILPAD